MADIFIASVDGKQVYKLPFIPQELPEISISSINETFETFNNGVFNLLSKPNPAEFSLSGKLPLKKYAFRKSSVSAHSIINLLQKAQEKAEPIKVTIYRDNGTKHVSMLASVENLKYSEGVFLNYSADLKEYRNYGNLSIAGKLNKRTR